MKATAIIANVQFVGEVATGLCKAHSARPELVGHEIRTSRVVSRDDHSFETLNTHYAIEVCTPCSEGEAHEVAEEAVAG
jgi:hypothetical protein